jgi:hypothetical protein
VALLSASPLAAQESSALLPSRLAPTAAEDAAPQAIDHSDAYYRRLDVHRYGSYAMLPLFAGEYLLGNKLLHEDDPADWVKSVHVGVAGALGAVFVVNSVTGIWNLIEGRNDPDATKRWLHAALMLGADAAMVYTATLGDDAGRAKNSTNHPHRDWALVSISSATAGTLLMWLWPD